MKSFPWTEGTQGSLVAVVVDVHKNQKTIATLSDLDSEFRDKLTSARGAHDFPVQLPNDPTFSLFFFFFKSGLEIKGESCHFGMTGCWALLLSRLLSSVSSLPSLWPHHALSATREEPECSMAVFTIPIATTFIIFIKCFQGDLVTASLSPFLSIFEQQIFTNVINKHHCLPTALGSGLH